MEGSNGVMALTANSKKILVNVLLTVNISPMQSPEFFFHDFLFLRLTVKICQYFGIMPGHNAFFPE